ncbi:hypothetical protein [Sphingobium chungbukense]|nr:hypothetical protein [Sphingobium chungbukense]
MVRSLPFLAIRKPPAAMAMERDAKEEHPCGLRHVHSCGNWSIMAAILWWALRNRD